VNVLLYTHVIGHVLESLYKVGQKYNITIIP